MKYYGIVQFQFLREIINVIVSSGKWVQLAQFLAPFPNPSVEYSEKFVFTF